LTLVPKLFKSVERYHNLRSLKMAALWTQRRRPHT